MLLITSFTCIMRGFGWLSIWLQRIGKNPGMNFFKLIPLLLSIPCFRLSNYFFQLIYLFQHRMLLEQSAINVSLGAQDYLLEFKRDLVDRHSLIELADRLRQLKRLAEAGNCTPMPWGATSQPAAQAESRLNS